MLPMRAVDRNVLIFRMLTAVPDIPHEYVISQKYRDEIIDDLDLFTKKILSNHGTVATIEVKYDDCIAEL